MLERVTVPHSDLDPSLVYMIEMDTGNRVHYFTYLYRGANPDMDGWSAPCRRGLSTTGDVVASSTRALCKRCAAWGDQYLERST